MPEAPRDDPAGDVTGSAFDSLNRLLAGSYEVSEQVGEGGMAVVYRARDTKHDRTVAIKVLKPELATATGSSRFHREIQIAARLQHPGILPLHDSGSAGDVLYAVMPFVEGETLADRIDRKGALELEEVLARTREMAEAIDYAHSTGLVHRDIKPSNVLLSSGHSVLADFGLATALDTAEERLTVAGNVMGTLAYMSPEQGRGEELDHRSDLYSFGCVVYEMLAGHPPFGGDMRVVLARHASDAVPPLAGSRPELTAAVDAVLATVMAKEPGSRFASARAFSEALEAAARGESARSRTPLLVGTVLVVAAVAVLALLRPWESSAPAHAPAAAASSDGSTTVAVLPFTVRGDPEFAYLGQGLADLFSTKLDGAGNLRSVDSHALFAYVEDREVVPEEVAEHFEARLLVRGDVLEAGGNLNVSASLYEHGRTEPIGRATVEGEVERVFDLLDDLVSQLLAERFGELHERLQRITTTSTDSLPALKAYLQGEETFRAGRFTEAVEHFEEAVEHDPEYALAWYRLSRAYEWRVLEKESEHAAQKALEFSDRLSERDRRLLEARLANRRGDAVLAERLYNSLLSVYPDDVEGWEQLAEVRFHYGPLQGVPVTAAKEPWERVLYYDRESVLAMWHLARIAAAEGDLDAVNATVDRILALNPENDRALEMNTLRAFATGDDDLQERVLAELAGVREMVVATSYWNAACFGEDLQGTRRVVELNTRPDRAEEARAVAHIVLAYLDVGEGRWESAWGELDAAAALRPMWALPFRALLSHLPDAPVTEGELRAMRDALEAWDAAAEPPSLLPSSFFTANDSIHPVIRLHQLGLLEARLGMESALARAEELERIPPPRTGPFLTTDLAAEVRARVASERGDVEGALRELEGTRRQVLYQSAISTPHVGQLYGRFAHAVALEEAGEAEEALRRFSSFRFVSPYDTAFEPRAAVRRATILARLGRHDEATRELRWVRDHWRNADASMAPALAEIDALLGELGE